MGRKLLGVLLIAIIALLLSLFGPWSAKQRSAEMRTSIVNALKSAGIDGVSVDMSGNVAKLTGTLGSQDLLNKAKQVASSTSCETCKKKGKIWHGVVSELKVQEAPKPPKVDVVVQSPYTFNAVKMADGGVTIEGYVRNQAELDRVTREAKALFGDNLKRIDLKIANGAPNENWGNMISKYMGELAGLDKGSYILDNTQSLITGQTTVTATRDRINNLASNSSFGFNEAATITVPEQEAVSVGAVNSQSVCQRLFNDIKGDAKINFATDKSNIVGSEALLRDIAAAVKQCSTFKVSIEGHTDNVGQEVYNQWLSEERAKAVRDNLISRGVSADQITAVGFGEASPRASNDTDEGRAMNRRIEFNITTSE